MAVAALVGFALWAGEARCRADDAPSEHVEYFGYYLFLDDMDRAARGRQLDDLRRVADHANVVKFNASLPHDADGLDMLVRTIQRLNERGLKSILAYPLIYGDMDDQGREVHPDRRADWEAYVAAVTPHLDRVAAFYLIDEPHWVAWLLEAQQRGVTWQDLSLDDRRRLVRQTRDRLEAIIAVLKRAFPDTPTVMVEAYPVVAEADELEFTIPRGVDWVGFNCYGPFENCAGRPIPQYFDALKRRMTSTQRLIAVPPAFVRTAGPHDAPDPARLQALRDTLAAFRDYIRTEPRFVAVLAFTWHGFAEGQTHLAGLAELDDATRATFTAVGQSMLAPETPRPADPPPQEP